MDITTIVVLGLYTVVYVAVFIIQQNQVKAQKGTIDSMKSFFEIFNVDEVRKFVEMREETMKGTLENFANSDKRIKESFDEFMKDELKKIGEVQASHIRERYFQVAGVVLDFIKYIPKKDRVSFVKNNLSLNEELFINMLVEIDSFEPDNPVFVYKSPEKPTHGKE